MTDHAIIVFTKNPELGKVKTRLAQSLGEQEALKIYKNLITLTQKAVSTYPTFIYYSEYIDVKDEWQGEKRLQSSNPDLGEKMKSAFEDLWTLGYKKLILIGTDCPDISKVILHEALEKLETHAAILGLAFDGGYYAIGFNTASINVKTLDSLFTDKKWSHEEVANEATNVMKRERISYSILPTLQDVDIAKDWENYLSKL